MPIRRYANFLALFPLPVLAASCSQTANPSFPVTVQQASRDFDRMDANPKPLHRPLVIIGGFIDPGVVSMIVGWEFDSIADDKRIITVPMGDCFSFDGCRSKVIDAIEAKFPSNDPKATVEVDVIGLSMGGLVARYSSMPRGDGKKQLRIARLFTVSSPLRGADSAVRFPPLHPLMKPMRPGSSMITEINAHEPDYPVFSYVRIGDHPVGAPNAALPGRTAWWVPTPWLNDPHNGAMFDPRILADIARRLRDEPPFSTDPPAPLNSDPPKVGSS